MDYARRRASKLSEQRHAELDELGMRWWPEHIVRTGRETPKTPVEGVVPECYQHSDPDGGGFIAQCWVLAHIP